MSNTLCVLVAASDDACSMATRRLLLRGAPATTSGSCSSEASEHQVDPDQDALELNLRNAPDPLSE
jgi:hypothetical protein